jgi:hypothetical protein
MSRCRLIGKSPLSLPLQFSVRVEVRFGYNRNLM